MTTPKTREISAAVSCAKAASRALQAVRMWVNELPSNERQEVLKRLRAQQEWIASDIWDRQTNIFEKEGCFQPQSSC